MPGGAIRAMAGPNPGIRRGFATESACFPPWSTDLAVAGAIILWVESAIFPPTSDSRAARGTILFGQTRASFAGQMESSERTDMTLLNTLRTGAIAAILSATALGIGPAAAAGEAQPTYLAVVASLQSDGYTIVSVKRSLLGRYMILARNRTEVREVVVSSSTGEIKSDMVVGQPDGAGGTLGSVGGTVDSTVGAVGGTVGAVGGTVGSVGGAVGGAVGSVGGAVGEIGGAVGDAIGGLGLGG
jgi:hypothetical protein